jgi:hypothetical protein
LWEFCDKVNDLLLSGLETMRGTGDVMSDHSIGAPLIEARVIPEGGMLAIIWTIDVYVVI